MSLNQEEVVFLHNSERLRNTQTLEEVRLEASYKFRSMAGCALIFVWGMQIEYEPEEVIECMQTQVGGMSWL